MKKLLLLVPMVLLISGCALFGQRSHYDPAVDKAIDNIYDAAVEEIDRLYDEDKATADDLYKDDYLLGKATLKSMKDALELLFRAQKNADTDKDDK